MGNFLRLVGTLAAIAMVASFGLSAVFNATNEITEEYKRQEQTNARIEALGCAPDAFFAETTTDSVVSGKPFAFYTAYPEEGSGEIIGYAYVAYGKGYSSTIETIVGVDAAGRICATETTFQQETPGLGAKVVEIASQNTLWDVIGGNAVDESGMEPWFEEQFNGMDLGDIRVVKSASDEGVLAITGATISSDAVARSVKEGLAMLVSIVGVEGGVSGAAGGVSGAAGGVSSAAGEVSGEAGNAAGADPDQTPGEAER